MLQKRRRFGVLAGLAGLSAMSLVLGGCSLGVPRSGQVQAGLSDLRKSESGVLFDPASPVPGASQEEIVRGFVAAAASATDNYAIARQYLIPRYSQVWQPDASVLIDDGARRYSEVGEKAATLSVSAIAAVDGNGELVPTPTQQNENKLRFEFEKYNGEWRIASAPSGIVLDKNIFNSTWLQSAVAFTAKNGDLLLDNRWVLRDGRTVTELLQAMVTGPTKPLQQSVAQVFPQGAHLIETPVKVTDGEAVINFSQELGQLDESQLDVVNNQVNATLAPLNVITQYKLQVNGRTVRTQRVLAAAPRPVLWPYFVQGDKLASFEGASGQVPVGQAVVGQRPLAATLGVEGSSAAILTQSGVRLVTGGGVRPVDGRAGVLPPSLDRYGFVWTAASGSDTRLLATSSADNSVVDLVLPHVGPQGAHRIQVSPDGTRLAILADDNGNTRVYVAGISRNVAGKPTAVDPIMSVSMLAHGKPVDFSWLGNLQFAVLTQLNASQRVTTGGNGSFNTDHGNVPTSVAIYGNGAHTSMRLLTERGTVLRFSGGTNWTTQADDVKLLVKR
ncbi:MAG: LpqB family beta-propeller domain-containing protein [Microbacteriaceae bacterium]|nr:LpqB family beta-propeller domain-containing protein [Microbacteriaceae bacterium]